MSEAVDSPPSKRMKLDEDESSEATTSKYDNYVSAEELNKLKEFKVLDEVRSNDGDSNEDNSDSSDGKSDGLPEEEIEKMLEEDLPEGFKGAPKPKEKPYVTRQKIVLEEKGVNQFEVLPLDWMMVRHCSGMPVYMHRQTRVCTLSKPYFLGKGNTRRHEIPISAIPCLAYRRALEEEEKQNEIDRKIAEQIKNGTWINNDTKSNDKSQSNDNESNSNDKKTPFNDSSLAKDNTEKPKCPFSKIDSQIDSESSQNKAQCDSLKDNADQNTRNNDNETLELDSKVNINESDTNGTQSNDNLSQFSDNGSQSNDNGSQSNDNGSQSNDNGSQCNDNASQSNDNGSQCNDNGSQSNDNGTESNDAKTNDVNDEIPLSRRPVLLPGGIVMPPPRVETVNTSWKTQHLTAEQINDYCKSLFKFKTVNIMHFKRWADRRKYTKARKTLQYPTLPEGTKLISIPAQPASGQNGGKAKRDWVMNMNGCSYLSVFHEYVRRALHKQPVYEFKQLENACSPYQATVHIDGMQYGVGRGSSKRQAKAAAARASIHILIPEMRDDAGPSDAPAHTDFTFFDYVGIEDPRIQEFCAAASEPSPHAILRTCLLRNFGAQDRHIHTEMKKLEYQKIELTMTVGKHTATVVCKNKKQAKQRASQSILQQLHPHIRSWGSLLRLYGSRSMKSCKEKKLEEQQITLLQDKARHNEPNYAVLQKLRNEMRKLKERDEAVVPIGTLLVADDLPTHSGSNLNNVDL